MSASDAGAKPERESRKARQKPRFWTAQRVRHTWIVYLVAVLLSYATTNCAGDPLDVEDRHAPEPYRLIDLGLYDDNGPILGGVARSAVLEWLPAVAAEDSRAPVLLLHGSPGSASNFDELGPALAASGRKVYALDLPGFGYSETWAPSYSILAHAHAALQMLDAYGIERAHVVGWSMGGGVALHMADLEPERVASLSLLASIGVQEGEGSGSYYFEHAKYAALYVGLLILPDLIPHFGLIGCEDARRAFVRNFWDTDQRPLRHILERTRAPLLIVHGRDDFLVPVSVARESHALVAQSRLVILEGSHFLPFGRAYGNLAATTAELAPFFARHDAHGVAQARGLVDHTQARQGLKRWDLEPFELPMHVPWWLQIAVLVVAARWSSIGTAAFAGALLAALQLDVGIALLSIAVGSALQSGKLAQRIKRTAIALGVLLASWIAAALAGFAGAGALPRTFAVAGLVASVAAALAFARWRRRSRIRAQARAILGKR